MKKEQLFGNTKNIVILTLSGMIILAALVYYFQGHLFFAQKKTILPIHSIHSSHTGDGPVLKVRGDWGYPPFEYLNEDGEPEGFNIDILTRIAEIMNLNILISLGEWQEVRNDLAEGRIDIVTGMYKTETREKTADFSIPHFISSYGIFVPDGSQISGLEDIRDKRIIVQAGDLGHDYVVEQNLGSEIIVKREWEDLLHALADGEGDCVVMAMVQGMIALEKSGLKGIGFVGPPLLQQRYSIAVRKGDAELLAILNEGLNILKSSGEYDVIYEKWLGIYEPRNLLSEPLFRGLLAMLTGAVLLLLLGILWSVSLRRQVRRRTVEAHAARTAAEQANESKSRLLAVVGHELRGPLHGTIAAMRMLEKTTTDPEQLELLDMIRMSTGQLSRILSDLFETERIGEGKIALRQSVFKLDDLTKWISPVLETLAGEKKISLEIDIPENSPVLKSDKERIVQIIMNLAGNGIKCTDNGGVRVVVDYISEPGGVFGTLGITVSDTGRGIDEASLKEIFNPFFQIKRSDSGLGLGLYVVKTLTKAMGGTIDVTTSPGEGSVFYVSLPVKELSESASMEREETEKKPSRKDLPSGRRVLIVEDEGISRLYLKNLLMSKSWKVDAAADGEEALDFYKVNDYDLVLMDITLPRMSGIDVVRIFRELEKAPSGNSSRSRTPVVAMTGLFIGEDSGYFRDAGIDGYLSKPFEESELHAAIAEVLNKRVD